VISHRPAMSIDRNFIAKSWIASYRDSNTAGMISVDAWFEVMTPQVVQRMSWPGVQTVVAYEDTNPDHASNAYGFIVADTSDSPPLLYYLFVKTAYRRSGIARGLLAAIGLGPKSRFNYVCSTPIMSVLQQKIPLSKWTPLLGRFPKSERRKAG
jgi:uncharacterized membrane protein YhdT